MPGARRRPARARPAHHAADGHACIYTSITTICGLCVLVVSGIQPVIDFGWMMTTGIALAWCSTSWWCPA